MNLRKWSRADQSRSRECGQATTLLLVGMVVAILAVTMLLMRIGHANDLRTRARQAADAAALAAVTSARNQAIAMIINQRIAPLFVQVSSDAENDAREYARRNLAVVTNYQSGGMAAKVSVRTRQCIKSEKDGGKFSAEDPCVRGDDDKDQTNKDGARTATATSAAVLDMPTCLTEYYPEGGQYVECEGNNVTGWSWPNLADLFKVHLSDTYNPVMPLLAGGGNVPNLPPASDPERHANEELGQKLARDLKHWEGQEWECLDQLWLHESGWDHHADNPTSDAYGIPQSLPGSKMASEGSDWATNPETQIKWGLNYIDDRYGTPCNAWAQWQARSPHWY